MKHVFSSKFNLCKNFLIRILIKPGIPRSLRYRAVALKGSSHCGLLPLYEEQTKQPIAISDPKTCFICIN